MGGGWFGYVFVFAGCAVFLVVVAAATAVLYGVARRRGELAPTRVRVLSVGGPPAPGEDDV